MALQPFTWGANGGKASPSSVKKQAEIAAALAARGGAPQNLGEGLNRIGEALLANSYSSRAEAGEAEGAAARKAIMDALMGNPDPTMADISGALGNEWVTSDPGSSAVLQALMGAEIQQNDPLRQQQLAAGQLALDAAPLDAEYKRAQIDALSAKPAVAPTDDMQEYEAAKAQGFTGTLQDWIAVKPGGGVTVNNNMGGSSDFYKKVDTDLGEQTAALIDEGRNAASNNMRLGKLEELLATAPQGAAGTFVQVAGQLGIPMEGLSEIQAAQAIINQMVPGQRPPGSGTMSDADLALFKQSLPAIANQPGGNQLILQTARAVNEYTIAQAAIAQKVASREITPAEGAALQAQIPNPLADFQGASAPAAAPGPMDYNAPAAPEGWGGDPALWQFMSPEDRALW
jgi:hypothetical protein